MCGNTLNYVSQTLWGLVFASRHYEFAEKSLDSLALLGSAGQSTIIGQDAPAALRDAAMMNGLLIHGLDYDDTHLASVVHCTASAFPAALALAEQQALSGENLMLATLIAIEIDAMLGTQAGGVFQQVRVSSHRGGWRFRRDSGRCNVTWRGQ